MVGQVVEQRVRQFDTNHGDTLEDAILSSKGLTTQANVDQAYVVRKDAIISVNLGHLLFAGDETQNVVLQTGDVVYVPEVVQQQVFVLGYVTKPTPVAVSRPITVKKKDRGRLTSRGVGPKISPATWHNNKSVKDLWCDECAPRLKRRGSRRFFGKSVGVSCIGSTIPCGERVVPAVRATGGGAGRVPSRVRHRVVFGCDREPEKGSSDRLHPGVE